ncbi:MAG: efflux RND transporter periplasmic adaptor subunit [Rhodanobacter sp.]
MKRAGLLLTAIVLAVLLVVAGYLGGRRQNAALPQSTRAPAGANEGSRTVLYWYDPMLPEQHFPKPGMSPMGMEMVPKYANPGAPKTGVSIDPRTVENLGLRTAIVQRRVLDRSLRVPGTVTWDLRQATTLSARVDGIVTHLDVRAPFTTVKAGQPLAQLLSAQWSSAVAEYAALLQARSSDAQALRAAARQRLLVMGLTEGDIRAAVRDKGAKSTITLSAPQAGVVVTVDVREGQRVTAGQTLMTLNGLSTVWVEAELPQADGAGIVAGTPVTAAVDAQPERVFHGTVETLLPQVDSVSRTRRARIALRNPDAALVPGMFATITLRPTLGSAVPVVPDGALIDTGAATRVIVADGDGHFRPIVVHAGHSADGYTAILAGLHGGERVVVSAQFLLDSEASLSGALERLGGPAPAGTAPAPASSAQPPMSDMPGMHP